MWIFIWLFCKGLERVIEETLEKHNKNPTSCRKKLYLIVPKSCECNQTLTDKEPRIQLLDTTPPAFVEKDGRKYTFDMYQFENNGRVSRILFDKKDTLLKYWRICNTLLECFANNKTKGMLFLLSFFKVQLQNVVYKIKIKFCWPFLFCLFFRSIISSVSTLPLWRASMTCIKQRGRALTRRSWSGRPGSSVRRSQTS